MKTRKIDVIAAEINQNWQIIVNLPEKKQMLSFYPVDAQIVAVGLMTEGIAYKPSAVPLVHNIASDLLPAVGREMARLSEFARQSEINKRAGQELDQECECVLPEQHCKVCDAAASRYAASSSEIPFCS